MSHWKLAVFVILDFSFLEIRHFSRDFVDIIFRYSIPKIPEVNAESIYLLEFKTFAYR